MMKIIAIVLSVLVGSILVARSQSDPSSSLSHLSPGVAISGSDLFYDVQVPGVGGVKVTGTQFLSWVFGNVSGNCTSSISGVFSCTGGNATGIAAGTNIVTSGTGTNVTVSTILTPTFTSITTTLASVTGWLTAAGVNMQTATIAGILNGSTANLTGNLTGTTGNFTGNLTSTSHQVIGFLTASGASFQSLTVAGNLTGGSGSFATSLTAGTIQATGFLTASGANFTTLTVTGLTPTGPNCLQETGGLLQATNSACSAPTLSIAAGSNISTSGTATNITVNVINNPTFSLLTSTIAAFPSYVTIGGANIFTATISNTLTMANSTTNSFGILDKADGSLYFQSGISTSGSGAVKIVNVDGGSPRFQVAVITDPNGRLSFGLDASNNPQIGFGLGISGRDVFINRQATGTLGFGTTAQGIDASISAGTMTLGNLTPTGPNCLQETNGVIQAVNAACSASVTTPKGGPILPSSEYLGGASGLLFPNFYIPNTNTSGAGAFEGIGYIATTTIATATLQFNMPETIPTGNARLRILQMANASTGSVQYTVSDAVTSSSNSLGTVTLNFEGVTSVAQTVADQLIEKKILLTVTPTSNQIMSIVIGTTSGVAQTITYQPSIVWE